MKVVQFPALRRLCAFELVSWPKELQASAEQLKQRLHDFGGGIFLFEHKGEDVCQVTVSPKRIPDSIKTFAQMRDLPVDKTSRDWWITNMATKIGSHGKGYATYLMQRVFENAYLMGANTLRTGVTLHPGASKAIEQAANNTNRRFVRLWTIEDYWPEDTDSKGRGLLIKVILK